MLEHGFPVRLARFCPNLQCRRLKQKFREVFRGWCSRRTCQQGVYPGEQIQRWHFPAFEDDSQAGSPFVHRAAFRGGERHRGFCQASAHRELAAGPAQPGFEIGAVAFGAEHAASRGSIVRRGQEFTRLRRWRKPFSATGFSRSVSCLDRAEGGLQSVPTLCVFRTATSAGRCFRAPCTR